MTSKAYLHRVPEVRVFVTVNLWKHFLASLSKQNSRNTEQMRSTKAKCVNYYVTQAKLQHGNICIFCLSTHYCYLVKLQHTTLPTLPTLQKLCKHMWFYYRVLARPHNVCTLAHPWNDPPLPRVCSHASHHRVGLTRPCLPVRKDAHIVPVGEGVE